MTEYRKLLLLDNFTPKSLVIRITRRLLFLKFRILDHFLRIEVNGYQHIHTHIMQILEDWYSTFLCVKWMWHYVQLSDPLIYLRDKVPLFQDIGSFDQLVYIFSPSPEFVCHNWIFFTQSLERMAYDPCNSGSCFLNNTSTV